MRPLALLLALGLIGGVQAAPASKKKQKQQQVKKKKEESAWGSSFSPIVGMDDRTGGRFGAAAYFYREKTHPDYPGFFIGLNVAGLIRVETDLRLVDINDWDVRGFGVFSRDREIYYGEGPDTPPNNPFLIDGDRLELDAAILRRGVRGFKIGLDWTLRVRHEIDVDQSNPFAGPAPRRLIPDETEAGTGLRVEWDNRDSILYPTRGRFFQLRGLAFPPEWSNRVRPKEYLTWQVQADYRHFQKVLPRVVWANRAWAGTSLGDIGYQYRYTLGGWQRLRGYGSNRFRGDHVYLWQTELRMRVWDKYLFAVASADLGGVVDGYASKLHLAQQLGLRIALPPDWGWKLRLEMGWGADQENFVINLGETF